MKKHVLLVDDEPEICFLLRNLILRAGMDCSIANNLNQARTALRQDSFDAVFLDVHLPDGLGYDLIPDVRKLTPGTICIAISAMDAERGKAVQAGADRFIPKPFTKAQVLDSLAGLDNANNKPN